MAAVIAMAMNRRGLLKIVSGAMATAAAAVIGVPGISYVVATVRRQSSAKATVRRVARLNDLPIGRPVEFAVKDQRKDAWTVHAKETVGRVWLVRRSSEAGGETATTVSAYSTACPHLGCAVKLAASGKSFVCPCHQAGFDLQGCKTGEKELGHKNPAPRDLDHLECRIVEDEDSGEQWVEVAYQKFKHGLTQQIPDA